MNKLTEHPGHSLRYFRRRSYPGVNEEAVLQELRRTRYEANGIVGMEIKFSEYFYEWVDVPTEEEK